MREEYLDLYADTLCRSTVLFSGVVTLIDALEAQQINWGIVTNKPGRFTAPLVKQLGLLERAASVVSGDTCPRAKPYPDSLRKAASDIGVAPESIVYVGDDERDVQAARAAGMGCIIAGYGYLGTDNHPDEWGADAMVKQPEEVLNYI
jgi:2-phosphoglycolate phosphatase